MPLPPDSLTLRTFSDYISYKEPQVGTPEVPFHTEGYLSIHRLFLLLTTYKNSGNFIKMQMSGFLGGKRQPTGQTAIDNQISKAAVPTAGRQLLCWSALTSRLTACLSWPLFTPQGNHCPQQDSYTLHHLTHLFKCFSLEL